MTPLPHDIAQLCDLIAAVHDGDAAASDCARLEARLLSDEAARRWYVRYMRVCAGLAWDLRELAPHESPAFQLPAFQLPDGEPAAPPAEPETARRTPILGFLGDAWQAVHGSPRVLLTVVAVALGGYFVVMMALVPLARWAGSHRAAKNANQAGAPIGGPAVADIPIGTIRSQGRTRWGSRPVAAADSAIRLGEPYELAAGQVEVRLARGVRVAFEGPAAWRFDSDDRLHFAAGKLVAEVSPSGVGFTVVTPSAEVIDLGTEFGVTVEADGKTDVHVLRGKVELRPVAGPQMRANVVRLSAGQAAQVAAENETAAPIALDRGKFAGLLKVGGETPSSADVIGSVRLGNLFDDAPGTPLVDAMHSDVFKRTPSPQSLGVYTVVYGGEPVVTIAPDVKFDLSNLGWAEPKPPHEIANDAWTHSTAFGGGLQLEGNRIELTEPKLGDGIGMHADSLITFDLDAIRAAGNLQNDRLVFRCDRAGVNDSALTDDRYGTLHLLVLVTSQSGNVVGVLDGETARIARQADRWSVTSFVGPPLRPRGPFVSFRVPLQPSDKYLTLAVAGAGDGIMLDHGTWLGACLQIESAPAAGQ